MLITALTKKTSTDERRIGSQSRSSVVITALLARWMNYRLQRDEQTDDISAKINAFVHRCNGEGNE